jgi:hypothetical protein
MVAVNAEEYICTMNELGLASRASDSRNMVMPGGIFASQHYGTCVAQ